MDEQRFIDEVRVHNFDTPKLSDSLRDKILEFRKCGLEIVPVDRIGPPSVMRPFMGFQPGDWVVCSMMAGSPMDGYPQLASAVYSYAYDLAKLNVSNPSIRMPLLNGGGADSPVTGRPGLMGEHSKGIVDAGYPLYCVISEGLITKEGLREGKGKVVCLIHYEGDTRVGLRTDSLIGISDAIVFWPGGFGTDTEALIRLTNTSINGKARGSRCLFVNLRDIDPATGEEIGYFDLTFRKNIQSYGRGGVRLEALKNLNNQIVVYNPPNEASAQTIKNDVISILFAIRKFEAQYPGQRQVNELSPEILNEMIKPLSAGSTIGCPYPGIGANGRWLDTIRAEVKAPSPPVSRLYRPNGTFYAL